MDIDSLRPRKKLRVEPNNVCCIRPLIQQLVLVGNFSSNEDSCEELLRSIGTRLSMRTAKNHIDQVSLRRLHGMTLLFLGFLVPSPAHQNMEGDNKLEMLSLVTFCLHNIYKRIAGEAMHSSVIDSEEMIEAFSLVLQTIAGLNCQHKLVQEKLSEKASHLKSECWELLKFLLQNSPTIEKSLEQNRSRVEELLFSLLKSVGNESNETVLIQKNADEIISFLKTFKHTPRKLATMVMNIFGNEDAKVEILFQGYTDEDRVFLWASLLHCKKKRSTLVDNISMETKYGVGVMETLVRLVSCERRNLSIKAIECMRILAEELPPKTDCTQMIEAIVAAILGPNAAEDTVYLHHASICLRSLIEREKWGEELLQSDKSQDLFSFIAESAFCSQDNCIAREAANILLTMISSNTKIPSNQRKIELAESFAVLTALLSSEIESVVEKSMDLVRKLSLDAGVRDLFLLNPKIFSALSKLASSEHASKFTRQQAIQIFSFMLEEKRHIDFLAREPKVLESLVCNSLQESGNSEKSRRLAVSILLRLSKNVCNRKILASTPGLLPSMIKYTRELTGQEEEHAKEVTRNEMKKHILLLASSL